MNEPLLLQSNVPANVKAANVKVQEQEIIEKVQIRNKLMSQVVLPVPVNEEFLEESVQGVKYEQEKQTDHHIWNTQLDLDEPNNEVVKKIFEGKRTPYHQVIEEANFISAGQVFDYNEIVYIGCKDGTIKAFDQSKPEGTKKSFNPHNSNELASMKALGGFLITQSVNQELIIWNISEVSDTGDILPEKIQSFEKVTCFEFKYIDKKLILALSKETKLYQYALEQGHIYEDWKPEIDLEDLQCNKIFLALDNSILIADKDENVIRLTIDDQNKVNKKLLREKTLNSKIQGFHFNYDIKKVSDDQDIKSPIITMVIADYQDKRTILATLNLDILEEEEELQRQKEAEIEKQKQHEEEMRRTKSEEEFQLWKLQQTQIQAEAAKTQAEEQQKADEGKEKSYEEEILEIGECTGLSLNKANDLMLISGVDYYVIFSGARWKNKNFNVRTEFQILKAFFSANEKYIYCLGQDGVIRSIFWKNPQNQTLTIFDDQTDIQDAIGTTDGKYFATLTRDQTRITIYSYEECNILDTFDYMDYTYLMNFSADSSALVCVQGTTIKSIFNIVLIKIGANYQEKVVVIPVKIAADYITQIDASLTKKEIYMIAKSDTSSSLHIYGFDRQCKKTIRDAISLSVSTDEKLLAYTNNSSKLNMIFIKDQQIGPDPSTMKKRGSSITGRGSTSTPNTRSTSRRSSIIKKGSNLIVPVEKEEKAINMIGLPEVAINVTFFGNNQKIVAQTASSLIGYNVYTHEILFKIQSSASKFVLRKLTMLFNQFLTFTDVAQRVQMYDVNYYLKTDFMNLQTKPLKKFFINVNPDIKIEHAAWANSGNHLILQMNEKLLFQPNPFNHQDVSNELIHNGPFYKLDGYYVPTLLGGPRLCSGSFAQMYNAAIEKNKEDMVALAQPIYPFQLNALHYFAMTSNVEGAKICFANRIKFMQDCFGKSPLDYAIQTKDKLIIEAILEGINDTEAEERIRIMRTLPLSLLVDHPASVLTSLLSQSGFSEPVPSKFGDGLTIPTLYPIKRLNFAESGVPFYSAEVAKKLHNPALAAKKGARNRPISTFVLNNPIPKNFTDEGMKLLDAIIDCSNDEIVRCKPITLFLNRKWDSYAYKFYFFQFLMFVLNLVTLTALFSFRESKYVKWPCLAATVVINLYFLLWELLQLALLGPIEYLTSFGNLLDVARLYTIFWFMFSIAEDIELPSWLLPLVFMLMWFKILSYLSVFKPTRYLIKMTFEIINDIRTFLIILFTALIAYAQINFIIEDGEGLIYRLRESYVLSYGELVAWDSMSHLQFPIFIIFSFFIPLTLMNMLIAIMSDSYSRVQTNAIAADARALAEMEKEMEEVVQYILQFINPNAIKDEFYYCFTTQVNDGDDEEDWEGAVGQLKKTIEDSTAILEQNLIVSVEEITKRNTEKIVDNLLKANKQELDVIDAINCLVQKETNTLRQNIEEKILQESNKTKEQFNNTFRRMEANQKEVKEEFDRTHKRMEEESNQVKNQFNETQKRMELESKRVEEEFQRTHQKITQDTQDMKSELQKAQEQVLQESQIMQKGIQQAQQKVEEESLLMKNQLSQAHQMINDVNSQVQTTSGEIVKNVQNTTSQTKEVLLKKIQDTNDDGTTKVKQQVDVQTAHHNEMVTFAVDTQKKVTDLLIHTADEQKKLLLLVDELKGVQAKSLQSITNQEQELERKKEFERNQEIAVKKIEEVLAELQAIEKQKSVQNEADNILKEKKEAELKEELKKIQDNLEKIQKQEEERQVKEQENLKRQQETEVAIKQDLKNVQDDLTKLIQK